jgi:hypothetical protein
LPLAEAVARIRELEQALEAIKTEAERENGRWVHLKRVIAIQCAQALTPDPEKKS